MLAAVHASTTIRFLLTSLSLREGATLLAPFGAHLLAVLAQPAESCLPAYRALR